MCNVTTNPKGQTMTYTVRDTETGETLATFDNKADALAAMAGCSDLKLVES